MNKSLKKMIFYIIKFYLSKNNMQNTFYFKNVNSLKEIINIKKAI